MPKFKCRGRCRDTERIGFHYYPDDRGHLYEVFWCRDCGAYKKIRCQGKSRWKFPKWNLKSKAGGPHVIE